MPKILFDSEELIQVLSDLCSDKDFERPKKLPKFTLKELLFIRDLIFRKPHDIVYFYLADHIGEKTEIGRMSLFNSKGYRKYLFLKNFFECKGNATKTAILSGYSPRSAKQQGHRILREIQWFCGRDSK